MALGIERDGIPFAVGSDYLPPPVRAKFHDQQDQEMKLIGFEPDQPPAPPEGPPADTGNFAADAARLTKIGANTVAQDVRELVGKIPVVGQPIQSGLDWVDEKTHGGVSSDALLKAGNEKMQAGLTRSMQSASQKKWWDQDKGWFGEAWSDPRAYEAGVLQSLPEQALMMFPAMRLAKGAYAAKIAAGATPEVASLAAARTAQAAGTVIEGSLGGAQSSRQVRDEILDPKKVTDAMLDKSEAFAALQGQGMNREQARKALADNQASRAFVTAGVATGLFGGMGDRMLAKIITNPAQSIGKRFVGGAVAEGVVEELPQSYLQQVAQNEAVRAANPDQSLTDDALNQGLGGMATGAIQGGGMAAIMGRQEAPASPPNAPLLVPPQAPTRISPTHRRHIHSRRWRAVTLNDRVGATYTQEQPALPKGQALLPRFHPRARRPNPAPSQTDRPPKHSPKPRPIC